MHEEFFVQSIHWLFRGYGFVESVFFWVCLGSISRALSTSLFKSNASNLMILICL